MLWLLIEVAELAQRGAFTVNMVLIESNRQFQKLA